MAKDLCALRVFACFVMKISRSRTCKKRNPVPKRSHMRPQIDTAPSKYSVNSVYSVVKRISVPLCLCGKKSLRPLCLCVLCDENLPLKNPQNKQSYAHSQPHAPANRHRALKILGELGGKEKNLCASVSLWQKIFARFVMEISHSRFRKNSNRMPTRSPMRPQIDTAPSQYSVYSVVKKPLCLCVSVAKDLCALCDENLPLQNPQNK